MKPGIYHKPRTSFSNLVTLFPSAAIVLIWCLSPLESELDLEVFETTRSLEA